MSVLWKLVSDGCRHEVSNLGDVRLVMTNHLTPHDSHGRVHININSKQRSLYVHRLVATAFIENPESHKYVYHKDGNKQNNKADNLCWTASKHLASLAGSDGGRSVINTDSTERWETIKDFESYKISSSGRVMFCYDNGLTREVSTKNKDYQVTLELNGKKCNRFIWRLLAEAFIPNSVGFDFVVHKDNNKSNNNLDNLEWGSSYIVKHPVNIDIDKEIKQDKGKERVECERCGTEVCVYGLAKHRESKLCMSRVKIVAPDSSENFVKCNRCGVVVSVANENNHRLSVGCFKKYLSENSERPYTKFDTWLDAYIEKRRSKTLPFKDVFK